MSLILRKDKSEEEFYRYFCSLISNEIGLYYHLLSKFDVYSNTVDLMYSSIYLYTYAYMKHLNYFDLGAVQDAFEISATRKVVMLRGIDKSGVINHEEVDIEPSLKLNTTVAQKYFISVIMQILCLIIYEDKDVDLSSRKVIKLVMENTNDILASLEVGVSGFGKYRDINIEVIYRNVKNALSNEEFLLSTKGYHERFQWHTTQTARLLEVIGTIKL